MTDVFISYSRKDKAFVQRLHNALTVDKRDSWVDWEDIPRAADWLTEIYRGIDAADTFVFVVSPDSLASEICNQEAAYAIRQRKRIIPLVYRDADEKALAGEWFNKAWEQQARENWTTVKHLNWLFFREGDDFEVEFRELLKAMDTDLSYIKAHTRLLVRAREWDANKRDAAYALRGDELAQAENWLAAGAAKEPKPTELHAEYVVASQKVREQERKRQRNLLQARLGLVLAVALVAVLGLVFTNLRSSEQTSANATLAVQSTAVQQQASTAIAAQATSERRADEAQSLALAANAQVLHTSDPLLALPLALAANRIENSSALARKTLADIAYAPGIVRVLEGHQDTVTKVVFLPDGETALSASSDDTLILWTLSTGQPDYVFRGHRGEVWGLDLSPDGQRALSASFDGTLILWDLKTRTAVRTFTPPSGAALLSVAFSPDGKTALSGSSDGTIVLWELDTGNVINTFYRQDEQWISCVAFSPDGKTALSGSSDGVMTLWQIPTGEIERTFTVSDPGFTVRSVVFSADGHNILTASDDASVSLWDTATGDRLKIWKANAAVAIAMFGPDENTVLAGVASGEIVLWDTQSGQVRRTLIGHSISVRGLAFNPKNQTLLSASGDKTIILWDWAGGKQQKVAPLGVTVFANPYADNFLANAFGGGLVLKDSNTGATVRSFVGQTDQVYAAAFSPDGKYVLTASDDNNLILWDINTGSVVNTFAGHTDSIMSIAFSPDSQRAVSASEDSTAILWSIPDGKILYQFGDHRDVVTDAVFSPDGTKILSASLDDLVILWDVASGDVLKTFTGHTSDVNRVIFSPDGKMALSGDTSGTIILWDIDSGKAIRSFAGQGDAISALAFSPDGTLALSGAQATSIFTTPKYPLILWDVNSGAVLRTFFEGETRAGSVRNVTFSHDGHSALINFIYNLTRWRIDTFDELMRWTYANRYVRELTCEERLTYQVEPYCDASGLSPTRTPYPGS